MITAVDKSEQHSGPVVDLLIGDAVRAAGRVDPYRIVTRESMRRAAIGGAIGSVMFAIAFWLFAPSASRAINVVGTYMFPSMYAIQVTPGSIKVREGQPVTVTARIPGMDGGVIPSITVGQGEAARSARHLQTAAGHLVDSRRLQLGGVAGRLDALSPLGTLRRGYAVARTARGETLRSVRGVTSGDPFDVLLADGTVHARVESVRETEHQRRDTIVTTGEQG